MKSTYTPLPYKKHLKVTPRRGLKSRVRQGVYELEIKFVDALTIPDGIEP
ncbi:MAG: hypothetical protein IJ870_06930 [Alphaproteobacteria bacterium]|nr:hypothetical protein [Alphaproteobacteria bacterium]